MIPLSVPKISGNEWKYVKDCLDTGWISSAGEYVNKFELAIKDYTGSKYAIACINGTAGLHISLNLANIGSDDIVIAPNLTFVATLNSISYTGAQIILIDALNDSWQIDVNLIQKWLEKNTETKIIKGKPATFQKSSGKKIGAIVPVYVLGGFVEIDKLLEISSKYGIPLIEDSTEALGSFKNKKHAGTFGLTGVISFNGNKIISTGGGGMILTDNKEIAIKAKHISTTAKKDSLHYFHDEIGYNYRLVNILAAIGLGQIENFNTILKRKKEIDFIYRNELNGIGDIKFQKNSPSSNPNCWLFTFRTKTMSKLLNYLNSNGIQSRPFWTPMNRLPMYSKLNYISEYDYSNQLYEQCISIPSSSNLKQSDQEMVVSAIKNFYNK
ncbi:MAG: LegC family aminotransferase [Flavobacteriaceae bacterium]|jgi:perosamine synthetase|nr:LegC family aminotransferase [Flavobacteriaceae bacterium]